MRHALALVLTLAMVLMATVSASAGRPLVRSLKDTDGLPLGEVKALAQDADGVVWIGGYSGVTRWDGTRMVQADGGLVREEVSDVLPAASGEVYARTAWDGTMFRVRGDRTALVEHPPGEPLRARCAALDAHGRPVVVSGAAVLRLRDGHWELLREHPLFDRASLVLPRRDDDIVVVGWNQIWSIPRVGGEPTRLATLPLRVRALFETERGTVWAAPQRGELVEIDRDGEVLQRIDPEVGGARAMTMGADGTLWVGGGLGLTAVRPGGEVTRFTKAEHDIDVGGALLVDREGSLWMGTYDGVKQIASPDIRRWGVDDNLVSDLVRRVSVTGDQVHVTSWHTPMVIDRRTRSATPLADAHGSKSQVCVDGDGIAWMSRAVGSDGPVVPQLMGFDGTRLVHAIDVPHRVSYINACALDAQGVVWTTVGDEIIAVRGDRVPVRHPLPRRRAATVGKAVAVVGDRLHLALGRTVCTSRLDDLRVERPSWGCEQVPGSAWITVLTTSSAGRLWAASSRGVVARNEGGSWRPIPGLEGRPSTLLGALAPSAVGGMWVGGHQSLLRVRDRPDLPDGYELLQDLSRWIAPHVGTIRGLAEDPDGTLWIAHSDGVTAVPREAQQPDLAPPSVSFQDVRIDGVDATLQALSMPSATSVLRLRASAPSYRAPQLLRFRSRIDRRKWTEPVRDGIFELQGLGAGAHTFEVAASLDGVTWTDPPARLELTVPRSWYARPTLWLMALAVLSAAALGVQQLRTNLAMRLERVRTRIALDLHDEVGAGLGSVGLLGSVLGRDLPPEAVHRVGDEITDVATDLSHSLRGIVWSLQPSSQNLDQLGAWLADRARTLLGDLHDSGALFVAIDPACTGVALDLDVLRAAQLVGIEALHNVAKHAQASHVRLAVQRDGHDWYVEVADDGVGLGATDSVALGHGLGVAGMRRRAEAVGGRLEIDTEPGRGTRVRLWMPKRRRLWR